ncbi:MAG: alanine racemase [Burkholderiaceae bacterium]
MDQIDTPALVIDLDAMECNITRMADFARKHQVLWRPHAKAHKCAELALWLQRAGATGACVQRPPRPRHWRPAACTTSPSPTKIALPKPSLRLARSSARPQAQGGQLTLAVDSADGIHRLAEAMAQAAPQARIGVLVEIDRPGAPRRAAGRARPGAGPHGGAPGPGCTLPACMPTRAAPSTCTAPPSAATPLPPWCRQRATRADLIAASGLAAPLVTGSGTGTLHEAASGVFGELQAGSFLFMDAGLCTQRTRTRAAGFRAVLLRQDPGHLRQGDRAVCDAGHKRPCHRCRHAPGGLAAARACLALQQRGR